MTFSILYFTSNTKSTKVFNWSILSSNLQVCVQDFCEELEYWGLNDLHMEPCCQHTYYRARWLLPAAEEEGDKEEDFGDGFCAPTQRQLWNLFENPHHSKAAKVRIKYYFLSGL